MGLATIDIVTDDQSSSFRYVPTHLYRVCSVFKLFALRRFSEKVADSPDQPIRELMTRLLVLYGLWSLERSYIAYLAAGQLISLGKAVAENGTRAVGSDHLWYVFPTHRH